MVTIEETPFGSAAVLSGELTTKSVEAIRQSGARGLDLNSMKGWREGSLELLRGLTHLESLTLSERQIESIEPIHYLPRLKRLSLVTSCACAIRFAAFPLLESFSIDFHRQKLVGLYECTSLTDLFMNGSKERDSHQFGKLVNLRRLRLLSPALDNLDGFRSLKGVKEMRLALCRRLQNVDGLDGMEALEDLNLEGAPHVRSIDGVSGLKQLRELYVDGSGELDSIKCLEPVTGLERYIMGKSIVDGDMSVLTRLPTNRGLFIYTPTPHLLRAISFDPSGFSKEAFTPTCFVMPLYRAQGHVSLSYGVDLMPGRLSQVWESGDPNLKRSLIEAIRRQAVPFLDRIPDLRRFERYLKWNKIGEFYAYREPGYALALLGQNKAAINSLNGILRKRGLDRDWGLAIQAEVSGMREKLLRDPESALRQLEVWEAFTIDALKIRAYVSPVAPSLPTE